MKRRSVLAGLAALTTAGCLGNSPPGTDSPTPTTTPTRTPTDTPGRDVAFSVTDRACGNGTNAASVSFAPDTITVDGTIGGRDTCDTALLDAAEWNDGHLTVWVQIAREKGTETLACAQCLTDIHYNATIPIGDGTPSKVTVIHRSQSGSQTVTTATP
jgi:hypothetical protein